MGVVMEGKFGLYKITNLINKKFYIGSTSSVGLKRRKQIHIRDLKQNKHHSVYLQNTWNKYGSDNFEFEVIMYCDPDKCLKFEQKCLDKYEPEYNVAKIAGSQYGLKRNLKTRQKMSLSKKSKIRTYEIINELAFQKRGKSYEQMYGIEKSIKYKKKIQKTSLGRSHPHTQEQKEKLSLKSIKRFEGNKLENHPNAILNWIIVRSIRKEKQEGQSLSQLAKKYNVKRAAIWKVVNNYSWIEKEFII